MRLLDIRTKEFVSFEGDDVPGYIILSHCWHGEETSFQHFTAEKGLERSKWSPGVAKVMQSCEQAKKHSVDHVWVDTCCIDKTSSAELQEAINSMYKWYERAKVCVIYLEDVEAKTDLKDSRWFTRGWTLQELIAPSQAVLINKHWKELGTREELSEEISTITGIPATCLGNRQQILSTTVAERMSWMGSRKTTRPEDAAYCLLGLFNVNMSTIYGEGAKAFTRLQKQIIQDIDDETVLLWVPVDDADEVPLLAPTPQCYNVCKGLKIEKHQVFDREFCNITKYGLELQTFGTRDSAHWDELELPLNCTIDGSLCVMEVIKQPRSRRVQWHRVKSTKLQTSTKTRWRLPLSDEEAYRKEHEGLLFNHSASTQRQNSMSHMKAQKFQEEVVRFKVLIS